MCICVRLDNDENVSMCICVSLDNDENVFHYCIFVCV